MTAMPDDTGSCVRHQSERGEEGGAERLFFLCLEQGEGAVFGIGHLLPNRTYV